MQIELREELGWTRATTPEGIRICGCRDRASRCSKIVLMKEVGSRGIEVVKTGAQVDSWGERV